MEECECFGESGSQHEKDENQRNCLGMRPSRMSQLEGCYLSKPLHFLYLEFYCIPPCCVEGIVLHSQIDNIFFAKTRLHLIPVFSIFVMLAHTTKTQIEIILSTWLKIHLHSFYKFLETPNIVFSVCECNSSFLGRIWSGLFCKGNIFRM